MSYLMQARDSVAGTMHFWTAVTKDFGAAGYTGPNAATEVAVVASVEIGVVGVPPNGTVTPIKLDANAGAYATYAAARAALTAGSIAAGSTVRTACRATAGDGGEGEWKCEAIETHVDNGGTILTGGSFALLRKFKGPIIVEWFGAIAHPTTSGTATGAQIQAALDAAALAQTKQIKLSEGYYRTELDLVATGVDVIGSGRLRTTIKRQSGAGTRVLELDNANLRGVCIDGTDQVAHAIWVSNGALKTIEDFDARNVDWDGIWLDEATNNNGLKIRDGIIVNCGTEYNTGTAAGTAGGNVVTITGAADLTTLGFRPYYDWVYFAAESGAVRMHEIVSLTSNEITIYPPLASTLSGAAYILSGGAGVNVTYSGDNLTHISDVVIQLCDGGGVQCQALYGTKTSNCIFENNLASIVWGSRGRADGRNVATVSPCSSHDYFESNSSGIDILSAYTLHHPVVLNQNENVDLIQYTGALRPTMLPETGDWTPVDASGAGLSFSSAVGKYFRSGRYITATGRLTYPSTANASPAKIGGLPFPATANLPYGGCIPHYQSGGTLISLHIDGSGFSQVEARTLPGGVAMTNADLTTVTLEFTVTYRVFAVAT